LKNPLFSKEELQKLFNYSSDVEIKEYKKDQLLYAYCKLLIDVRLIQSLLNPKEEYHVNVASMFSTIKLEKLQKEAVDRYKIEKMIFAGKLMVVPKGKDVYFYDISKAPSRQPDESVAEVSIRGPKDGFVEEISTNLGLIRKRLKTSSFVVKDFTIGKRTNTKVALLYIKDIINSNLLEEIQSRLNSINVDILTSSTMLGELLYDNKYTLSPLINYTGRPDFVVTSLNQGRFAIVIDGAPTVLIAPIDISFLFKTPEDDNVSFYAASLGRLLRFVGLFITTFLPGFYTALTSHHVGQLPLPLIATITVSRIGLPFSPLIEMIIMLLMIELFKEGGARLPKGIGQTVTVLGALIIGDAAIQGGITSSTMLVVIGITAISSYTLVNQSLEGNLFLIRFVVLILSYALGIYGFVFCVFSVFLYISHLKSFGLPYLANISSSKGNDIYYSIFRVPFSILRKRNASLSVKDETRRGK